MARGNVFWGVRWAARASQGLADRLQLGGDEAEEVGMDPSQRGIVTRSPKCDRPQGVLERRTRCLARCCGLFGWNEMGIWGDRDLRRVWWRSG